MIPMERTELSFWQKFRELQTKMFWQSDTVQNHMYSSEPLEWPLLSKGIAYWYQKETNVKYFKVSSCLNNIETFIVSISGANSSAWQHCAMVFHNDWSAILRYSVGFLLATTSSTNHWFERPGMDEISKRWFHIVLRIFDQLCPVLLRWTYTLFAQLLASTSL